MKPDINVDGHIYRHDPDYDCYYRVYNQQDLTVWNQYGWILVIAGLAILCAVVSG